MLTEIIEKLLKTERAATLKTAQDREYLYSDAAAAYSPVEDASHHACGGVLLDCASLIAWCEAVTPTIVAGHDSSAPAGQVTISRIGATLAQAPFWREKHVPRETANKPFFMGYMPAEHFDATLTYEDMLAWTELLGERLDDHAAIEHALKTVAAVGSASVKSEQDGGIIRLKGETEAGVKLNASIPKRLKARIPFGDPACEVDVQWSLQVTVSKDGAASFRLRHLISDGAFDGYAAWMREQLKALPEGWLVVCGP